jgi:hypothetical protein
MFLHDLPNCEKNCHELIPNPRNKSCLQILKCQIFSLNLKQSHTGQPDFYITLQTTVKNPNSITVSQTYKVCSINGSHISQPN